MGTRKTTTYRCVKCGEKIAVPLFQEIIETRCDECREVENLSLSLSLLERAIEAQREARALFGEGVVSVGALGDGIHLNSEAFKYFVHKHNFGTCLKKMQLEDYPYQQYFHYKGCRFFRLMSRAEARSADTC